MLMDSIKLANEGFKLEESMEFIEDSSNITP
jgi:hypothetical protein